MQTIPYWLDWLSPIKKSSNLSRNFFSFWLMIGNGVLICVRYWSWLFGADVLYGETYARLGFVDAGVLGAITGVVERLCFAKILICGDWLRRCCCCCCDKFLLFIIEGTGDCVMAGNGLGIWWLLIWLGGGFTDFLPPVLDWGLRPLVLSPNRLSRSRAT